ncbi:putative leader peptide [Streptomyces sp. AC154]
MSASGWAVSERVPLTTRRHIDLQRIAGTLCPAH